MNIYCPSPSVPTDAGVAVPLDLLHYELLNYFSFKFFLAFFLLGHCHIP